MAEHGGTWDPINLGFCRILGVGRVCLHDWVACSWGPSQQLGPTPRHPPMSSALKRWSGCPQRLAETLAPGIPCEQQLSWRYFASRHSSWVCAPLLGEILLTNPACDLPLKRPCLKRNSIKGPGFGMLPSFSWITGLFLCLIKHVFLLGFSTGVSWAVRVITVTMAILIRPE